MTKPYFILIMGILLALTGCTMMPDYKRPPPSVAAQYPGVTRTNESHAADIPWQDFLAEDRLKKLIKLALTNNLDFRVAMLNVEQSRAQYRITRSASFPTGLTAAAVSRVHANGRHGGTNGAPVSARRRMKWICLAGCAA
jgi:multidrug efflux system outer membrane protein